MIVYITEGVLKSGIIQEIEAVHMGEVEEGVVRGLRFPMDLYFGEGKDWHRSKASAIKKAGSLKLKRIQSLKKSIAKVKALKFTHTSQLPK